MIKKRVLILLCTYNGEKYLANFLDSIVSIKSQGIGLLVLDDGSTDRTIEILNQFKKKIDINIVENTDNLGARKNFLKILKIASDADWYFFADQDDIWHENKVKLIPENAGDIPLARFGSYVLIDECSNYIDSSIVRKYNRTIKKQNVGLIRNLSPGCTIGFNDKFREKMCLLPDEYVIMHDSLANQLANLLDCKVTDERCITYYRQHESNDIGMARNHYEQMRRRISRKNREEFSHSSWIKQITGIELSLSGQLSSSALLKIRMVKNLGSGDLIVRLRAGLFLSREYVGVFEKLYFYLNVISRRYKLK
jgi:glycosyltransferase involved in cell wall biosynthesis